MSDMKQKLLTAKGDELSRLLGEVLQPEHEKMGSFPNCIHCHCMLSTFNSLAVCERPIPLNDWNVAMKHRDWAVGEYGHGELMAQLRILWMTCDGFVYSFEAWLALYAQPEHYLIAAALCKLKGNEDE